MAHYRIWLRRLNRSGRWSRLPVWSLLNARQRARSNLSRQKCRVQSLRSTPVGAEPTSTRTSCAPSELLWATSITELQGLLRLLIRVRIPGGSYPALSTKWIRLPHSQCGDTGSSPVGVIRWLLRSSVIITGGSSMGELLIKTNPARDFNSNFKNCYPKAEVIGSNPIHRAVEHIQQFQPMAP